MCVASLLHLQRLLHHSSWSEPDSRYLGLSLIIYREIMRYSGGTLEFARATAAFSQPKARFHSWGVRRMDATHTVTTEDRSLARRATRLWIGACIIGAIAVWFLPEPPLRRPLSVLGFMLFCCGSAISVTTLRQIAQVHDIDPTQMWRRALLSCAAGTVAFVMILGPNVGAASSLLGLCAVAAIITALRAKRTRSAS